MRTAFILLGAVAFSAALHAQTAKPAAPAAAAKEIVLTATSANVKDTGTPVKIRIFRWSNDDERTPLVAALTAPPPAAPRAGAGGRAGAAAAGRGGGGRGGRGGGEAVPITPIQAFTTALQKAPTIGYLWTTDVTGYSIKYAWHAAQPDGSERIVLATDRRLGAYSPAWTPKAGGTATDYEFTLLELRLDAKGGEGKASLTTKITADNDTKLLSLENYAGAPAILQNVKKAS
jgi:hypothetical protein